MALPVSLPAGTAVRVGTPLPQGSALQAALSPPTGQVSMIPSMGTMRVAGLQGVTVVDPASLTPGTMVTPGTTMVTAPPPGAQMRVMRQAVMPASMGQPAISLPSLPGGQAYYTITAYTPLVPMETGAQVTFSPQPAPPTATQVTPVPEDEDSGSYKAVGYITHQ